MTFLINPFGTFGDPGGGAATVAVTDFAAGSRSGTTITLTASGTPSAGDIEFLWLSAVNMSFTVPAGWIKMYGLDLDINDNCEVWARVCTGGESATTSVTLTDLGSDAAAAAMVRVSDAEAIFSTFEEVALSGSAVTAQQCGVAYDDSLVLRAYTGIPSSSAWTAPSGHTEVVADQDSAVSSSTVTVMEQDALQAAGNVSSQGADMVSTAGTSQYAGLTLTLSPPQSGVRVVGAIKTEERGTFPIPVTLPPNVEDGDVLLMMIATRNAETPASPPTGWTEEQRTGLTSGGLTSAASTNEHAAVYSKVASSETGSVSVGVTDNGTESVIIDVVAIRGATGVDATSLGNGGVAPSVSGVSGGILVGWWGSGFGSFGVSPPSGMVPAPREKTADNGASSIAAFEKLTATGATGTRDIGVDPDFDAAVLIAVS